MNKILLSVYPDYARNIYANIKKVEFRKKKPKKNIDRILIYETSPVMRLTGMVDVEKIEEERLFDFKYKAIINEIYRRVGNKVSSNFKEQDLREYYKDSNLAVIFYLKDPMKFDNQIGLARMKELGIYPPQNFIYLNEKEYKEILKEVDKNGNE